MITSLLNAKKTKKSSSLTFKNRRALLETIVKAINPYFSTDGWSVLFFSKFLKDIPLPVCYSSIWPIPNGAIMKMGFVAH